MSPERCPACKGKGKRMVAYLDDHQPRGPRPTVIPCRHCEGTGVIPSPDKDRP